ncbi:hypothetical protein Pelo_18239 [Pelomyxa schiedti]|nr:hypothetical protein Pelo_18239 [Pelomyxa schiedti]
MWGRLYPRRTNLLETWMALFSSEEATWQVVSNDEKFDMGSPQEGGKQMPLCAIRVKSPPCIESEGVTCLERGHWRITKIGLMANIDIPMYAPFNCPYRRKAKHTAQQPMALEKLQLDHWRHQGNGNRWVEAEAAPAEPK